MSIHTSELRAWAKVEDAQAVSLFMPTHPQPDRVEEDRIRLRNLLRRVDQTLGAEQFSTRARAVLDDDDFWDNRGRGLALLAYEDRIEHRELAVELPERLEVGRRLCLTPLIAAAQADDYVLVTLSQKRARCYRGDTMGLEEVHLNDMPQDGTDDVPQPRSQRALQHHTTGAGASAFHGHLDTNRSEEEVLARLCTAVDDAVGGWIESGTPVFVYAVDRLASALEQHRKRLPPFTVVAGNPDELTESKLQKIVTPHVRRRRAEDLERRRTSLLDHVRSGAGSTAIGDVVIAAYDGRVERLCFNPEIVLRGAFDAAAREVSVDQEADLDLVDIAARWTLAHGGDVWADSDLEGVAAIFRHEA